MTNCNITVAVHIIGKRTHNVAMNPHAKIVQFKKLIATICCTSYTKIRLVFNGKPLCDHSTLHSIGCRNLSKMYVIFQLTGGMLTDDEGDPGTVQTVTFRTPSFTRANPKSGFGNWNVSSFSITLKLMRNVSCMPFRLYLRI